MIPVRCRGSIGGVMAEAILSRSAEIPGQFMDREELRAAFHLIANVLVVLGCGVAAWHINAWWAYVLAFVVVGARGQACYILQHELMHSLLFKRRATNEAIGVLLSSLLGTRFFIGRRMHMEHHRQVGKPADPNELFHSVEGREPGAPILRHFLFHLCGGRLILMAKGLLGSLSRSGTAHAAIGIPGGQNRIDLLALVAIQAIIFATISLASSPLVYLFLYVMPLSTLTAFFEALRSFSEHVVPGRPSNSAESQRSFFMDGAKLELFFISQFNFNFHHIHHLYPKVVTFKLKQLHEWLTQNDPQFQDRFVRRPGYVATALKYFLNAPFPGSGAGYPRMA